MILGPSGVTSKSVVVREPRITFRTLLNRHQNRPSEVSRITTSTARSIQDASVIYSPFLNVACELHPGFVRMELMEGLCE